MDIRDMDLGQLEQEREAATTEYSRLYDMAKKSPTFLSKHTAPSDKDVTTDILMRDLIKRQERLSSSMASKKWYGDGDDGQEDYPQYERDRGLVFDAIDFISRPLYMTVGSAKYALGQSSGDYYDSVTDAVRNRETFGPLLRKMGTGPKASMALGFGLDVLLDPVNIMMGGTAGIMRTAGGKVAVGAAKAGTKGAVAGAKATGLRIASRLSKLVPVGSVDKSARKIALKALRAEDAALELARSTSAQTDVVLNQIKKVETMAKNIDGIKVSPEKAKIAKQLVAMGLQDTPELKRAMTELVEPTTIGGKLRMGKYKLEQAANSAAMKYDSLVKFDIGDVIDRRANRISVAGQIQLSLEKSPKLAKFLDNFIYSPNDWAKSAKMMDEVALAAKEQGRRIQQVYNPATRRYESPLQKDILKILRGEPGYNFPEPSTLTLAEKKQKIMGLLDDDRYFALTNNGKITDTGLSRVALSAEAETMRKANQTKRSLRIVIGKDRKGGGGYTIHQFMEEKLKIGNVEIGKKIIDAYDIYQGLFVSAKISSLSPSSMMYATVGNPTMALMYGLKIFHPDNYKRMKEAIEVIWGTKGSRKTFDWMINDPTMSEFLLRRADTFEDVFGLNLRNIMAGDMSDDIMREILPGYTQGASAEKLAGIVSNVKKEVDKKVTGGWIRSSRAKDWQEAGEGVASKTARARQPDAADFHGSIIEPGGAFSRFKEMIKETAETSSGLKRAGAKALNFGFNRSKDFTKVDQTYKMKDFMRLVRDGITESELLKMTNNKFVTSARITTDDILNYAEPIYRGGERYFKIKPDKAMEIVSDIYMNYAAMPSFIKVMRGLPIVGHPFFAFTYAMAGKTGKAFVSNPAAFNKVNFLLREIDQERSPLVREALANSKYYDWMRQEGMVYLGENVPFFNDQPVFLNLAQVIPYLTMDIFNPSDRGFEGGVRGQIASKVALLPWFRKPEGQLLMDFIILPAILQNDKPVNMWGGPLYPEGSTGFQKLGYAGRQLAEAVMPSAPSAAVAPFVPEKYMEYFPSFHGRKVGYASRGKSILGVSGRESAMQRSFRGYASTFGLNFYPMDLTNISNEIKRRQEQ